MAHIVPRVEGVVTEVNKKLGDSVKAGEIIAVIESRELADIKAGYLAAVERYEMASWLLTGRRNYGRRKYLRSRIIWTRNRL